MEHVMHLSTGDQPVVEKLIHDDNIAYTHVVLAGGDGFPPHNADAPVYITVLRGHLTLDIAAQGDQVFDRGSVIAIPKGVRLHLRNAHEELLELIAIKSPPPEIP